MHRQLLSREEYLAELNRRLRLHPSFAPGMRFVVSGEDIESAPGFDREPLNGDPVPPVLFAEVASEVHSLYRVLPL